MSAILPLHPTAIFHHNHEVPRRSPQRSMSPFNVASSRKRKADDDDLEMGSSPAASPAVSHRPLRSIKRSRQVELTGRQLSIPRLIETLDSAQLRTVLEHICAQNPEIGQQVQASAPKPSAGAALDILNGYLNKLKDAMPYGNSSSDYAYNRVKQHLLAFFEALNDFTAQFLPPVETQLSSSLQFLDGATKMIHTLPNWESPSHSQLKDNAYDEICKAWTLVLKESSNRGGSAFQLSSGGWEQILSRHNVQSGSRLSAAVQALQGACNWVPPASSGVNDSNSIRAQLMSGTYGLSSVSVGHW